MKKMPTAQRLIVAADYKPSGGQGSQWVWDQIMHLAGQLEDAGVCIKVNSALRLCGYTLIDELHKLGLNVFADLKLNDIPETMAVDGAFLGFYKPEIVTAMCSSGVASLRALKTALPTTEVLGVTVLTSLTEGDSDRMFRSSISGALLRFASVAAEAGLDGLIAAPSDAVRLRSHFEDRFTINTPAIRPAWFVVEGDDQNKSRVMTPKGAIMAGADRIVVGRPITQAKDPMDAVKRTLDEIEVALNELAK